MVQTNIHSKFDDSSGRSINRIHSDVVYWPLHPHRSLASANDIRRSRRLYWAMLMTGLASADALLGWICWSKDIDRWQSTSLPLQIEILETSYRTDTDMCVRGLKCCLMEFGGFDYI